MNDEKAPKLSRKKLYELLALYSFALYCSYRLTGDVNGGTADFGHVSKLTIQDAYHSRSLLAFSAMPLQNPIHRATEVTPHFCFGTASENGSRFSQQIPK